LVPPADAPAPRPARRSRRSAFLCIGLAALLLVVASVAASLSHHSSGTTWQGTLDDPAFHKPEFVLTDDTGQRYDFDQRTKGQLTLLYFGYTHCPDFCPITMDTISGALNDLPDKPVTVVFVTTDPSRDTPAVLHRWLGDFDVRFVGLTGTPAQLAAAQKAAGVSVAIADKPDKNGNYQVGHAASVLAYTPDGLQHLSYPFGTTQSDWVHDIPQILGVKAWMRTS
jgi:protein SCO1